MFSVIFDMDGTLLDTQRICVPAWDYAGEKQGISGMGGDIFAVSGMNEAGWTKYLLDHYPNLDILPFKNDMRNYIIENLKVEYKKGAPELIEFLKQNNIKIGLASGSSRKSIDHHLKAVGAEDVFDVIVAGTEVKSGKPAPDIFLKTAELMGVRAEDCFVFEDSANGIISAARALMKPIGVPDFVPFPKEAKALMYTHLNDLSEAIELFKKLL